HPVAGRRIANLAAASIAFAADDLAAALLAHHNLLESDAPEVVATHAWRALELASVRGDRIDELVKRLVAVDSSPAAARWLDLIELADPTPARVARSAAMGRAARRARGDDGPRARAVARRRRGAVRARHRARSGRADPA